MHIYFQGKHFIKLAYLLIFIVCLSCNLGEKQNKNIDFSKGRLLLPSGDHLELEIVYSTADQTKGLSGRNLESFPSNRGMLFYYTKSGPRAFWMPDTYFDLDIVFLDSNFEVVDIEKKVPAHPGMEEPPLIARTRTITCRHVLELSANSPLAGQITIGTKLKWDSSFSLEEIESNIHRLQ